MSDYRLKFDYHTHTVNSDGKGSIEDNVRAAVQKGLSGIAISDHGPGHLLNGINKRKTENMRAEIDRLRGIYTGIDIFLSVEANIIYVKNRIDVDPCEFGNYDFIIAGYHYAVRYGSAAANFIHNRSPDTLPGRGSLKSRNTDMVVRAIYENPIKILTHPGDKGPFDIAEIARACADRGTWIEINNKHCSLTREDIRSAAGAGVKFVLSSDAHSSEKVGDCSRGIEEAIKAGLDFGVIVNIAER